MNYFINKNTLGIVKIFWTLICSLFLLCSYSISALDTSIVKEKWHTPYDLYLSPEEAFEMKTTMRDEVIFIDVRSRAEIQYAGFTNMVDANIPVFKHSTKWKPKKEGKHGVYRKIYNADFVAAVDKLSTSLNMPKSTPIILMCQSGSRSPVAAKKMFKAGYEKVYTLAAGFEGLKSKEGADKGKRVVNGWKNANLPWSYKLESSKMYFNFEPQKSSSIRPSKKPVVAEKSSQLDTDDKEMQKVETVPMSSFRMIKHRHTKYCEHYQ